MSGVVKTFLATIAGVLLTLGIVVYTTGGSEDGLLGALGDRGTTTTSQGGAEVGPAPAPAGDQAVAPQWSDSAPPHVVQTLTLIDAGDWPDAAEAPGTQGGERFGNHERLLPQSADDGSRLRYLEWDVNPKEPGRGRDAERIVTGSDGSAWYTADHYASFTRIR